MYVAGNKLKKNTDKTTTPTEKSNKQAKPLSPRYNDNNDRQPNVSTCADCSNTSFHDDSQFDWSGLQSSGL